MELQEIVDIRDGKIRLCEMSFPLSQVRDRLMNKQLKLRRLEHLILIYYFRKEQVANHWIGDLSGFIPESVLIKRKNIRLDKDTTYHLIWRAFAEDYSDKEYHDMILSGAKYEEKKQENKVQLPWESIKENPKDVILFMDEFHEWAANVLSQKGDVSKNEVSETILSLLKKHPLLI